MLRCSDGLQRAGRLHVSKTWRCETDTLRPRRVLQTHPTRSKLNSNHPFLSCSHRLAKATTPSSTSHSTLSLLSHTHTLRPLAELAGNQTIARHHCCAAKPAGQGERPEARRQRGTCDLDRIRHRRHDACSHNYTGQHLRAHVANIR